MIRFACPGCSANFTVAPENGGKKGQCPKCQSQFVIPDLSDSLQPVEASSNPLMPEVQPPQLPPPIPVSNDASEPIEIRPCPKCQSRLSVMAVDLGSNIECPNCQQVYIAAIPDNSITGALPNDPRSTDRGRGRSRRDEERLPTTRSRYRDEDDDDELDQPRRRRNRDRDGDDDGDDPDRGYRRRRYSDEYDRKLAPHRGVMILVFGIIGFTTCPLPIFSILAWVMGSNDLQEMDHGRMDSEGRGLTQAGRILGIVMCVLCIVGILTYCGMIGCFGIR
jgi:DNA-directed RNA polymerase subunit M/transcription elongation factor TFIIS